MNARRSRGLSSNLLNLQFPFPPHTTVVLEDKHPVVWLFGYRAQEVVGEASYMEELQQVLERLPEGRVMANARGNGVLGIGAAWLIREPTNPVDPDAIAIFMENLCVGYLSRWALPRWKPIIETLNWKYQRHVACTAFIVGRPGKSLGVWLMLDSAIEKPF